MKLYASRTSPYARKVRVVMAEKKIECQLIEEDVWSPETRIGQFNPLGKVPCLVMEDGGAIFDSRVIVEYVDTLTPVSRMIPQAGASAWKSAAGRRWPTACSTLRCWCAWRQPSASRMNAASAGCSASAARSTRRWWPWRTAWPTAPSAPARTIRWPMWRWAARCPTWTSASPRSPGASASQPGGAGGKAVQTPVVYRYGTAARLIRSGR